jgi:predicted nuclease of predicted toxin-antitoxin system
MKVLIDMNLSPRWVRFLNDRGIEATHWSSFGKFNATDIQIMEFAKLNEYVVLTHDLDFSGILASTHGDKPSVVQIRSEDVSPDKIGKQIASALSQLAVELENGALVTVDPIRTRLRLLPLPRKKETN